MLAHVLLHDKSYGDKVLYKDLEMRIEAGEKVGLIGRNGTGKTTLLHILSGEDTEFDGVINIKKGAVLVSSRQEHHEFEALSVLDYVLGDLPEYRNLKHIIDTYPEHMEGNEHKQQRYSDALDRFSQLGYFEVEGDIIEALKTYQLVESKTVGMLKNLSGGQKRMVELVKVQRAKADLALIDEPTNHMDFVAKESFIKWFVSAKEAIMVITHDRDVLKAVDRIIEIRDGKAYSFKGNYDDYLRINAVKITSEVTEFEQTERRIKNLRDDIIRFRRLKEKARDPGTIGRFKSLEQRAEAELIELKKVEKPSFWIDRESAEGLSKKMSEAYSEHKAKNIKVRTRSVAVKSSRLLVEASKLSLGYDDTVLFDNVSFQLREGEHLRLHGRNGAGKSTIVKAILAKVAGTSPDSVQYAGTVVTERDLRVGVYEQEIDSSLLNLTLSQAIEKAFVAKHLPVNDTKIKQQLSDFLFDPHNDGDMPVVKLSGGQKARLQIISMLAGEPQLLILDEPTNHLDLPSIEELEDALSQYHGAVIYISHDSYFAQNVGGTTLEIKNQQ